MALCFVLFCSISAKAQPKVYIDRLLQVVEVSSSDQEITKPVKITNTGTRPLKLTVERTSCGCTGAVLSSKTLLPKQTGTLTIKMQVSGWGTKSEMVILSTNDPKNPQLTITLKAKMPATVVPNPARLTIQAQEGQSAQRLLTVLLPAKATITKISAKHSFLHAKLTYGEPIDGGTMQRIEVSLDAASLAGKLSDELTIKLKNAPVSQIGVPVEIFVEPDISVEPEQIFLGQVAAGSTQRKTIVVQSHGKKAFAVKSIASDNPLVTSEASPDITADAHAIEVDVKAQGEVGSILQSAVKLTLSNGRVLEVPVFGMIVKANAGKADQTSSVRVGKPAPDFTITDAHGNPHTLSDLKGEKNLLLTFFPQCFTGGCAGQLASLQRESQNFAQSDTEVWAVSVDDAKKQTAFAAELGLQFPLLPDTERKLSMLFGAAQNKSDLAARQSVLIDKSGVVRWIDRDVHVETHGADVLAKMRELGLAK
jgi:peroxiredoxin